MIKFEFLENLVNDNCSLLSNHIIYKYCGGAKTWAFTLGLSPTLY